MTKEPWDIIIEFPELLRGYTPEIIELQDKIGFLC
jgi:hypothetical protein